MKKKSKRNKLPAPQETKEPHYKYKLLIELMEHIPDVIYFKDKKGRLVLVNHAHAKGLGLKPQEVIGKTDFDFFAKRRAEMMTRDDQYVMESGKPIIDKIERATRPDGVDNYVSTTKIPRYDNKGKIIGLIGITRDITQRMQFERLSEERLRIKKKLETLKELSKIKSDFISTVSHELRTPLSIVNQLVTLIFNEISGPINNKQREILVRTMNNIERLKKIIDELLDITRIESGRLKLNYSLVNLGDLIRESEDFFRKLAEEKGINLVYKFPKDEINIFIDAQRVTQVISNLINNAIKFTENNGSVEVEVKILENKVRIGVIDTGIGISRADLPKLFSKPTQISRLTSIEREGVGLGLSIAKEIVERYGGEIWAESELGIGSKFYFTLPLFYTAAVLETHVRDRINYLLDKGISAYLINLLIINYKEFKKRVRLEVRKLFGDLDAIINSILKDFRRPNKEKPEIILADMSKGKFSIILPQATEKEASLLSELLRNNIKSYFIKNKIQDVFIAVGLLPYSQKVKPQGTDATSANLNIKEIYIGSEIRRFKRIDYRTNIRVVSSDNKVESSQTVDISAGGTCFESHRPLKTDAPVKVRLELSKKKKPIYAGARVAWIKKMERLAGDKSYKYRIGLEFVVLKNSDRKALSDELKLYHG